ncbi:MAG: M15 family metallopeptidase [Vibrio sp.]
MTSYSLEQLTGLTQSHLTNILVGQKEFLVHHAVKKPLEGLIQDAKVNGFDFSIASSFRDYHRQAAIWNAKFTGERPILDNNSQPLDASQLTELEKIHAIMRWSALPGGSRHHWGCELDVYARNCLPENVTIQLEPWEYETGHQAEFFQWLTEAMPKFGFYLPYQQDLGGVAIEPWHISEVEIGKAMLNQLSIDALQTVWQQNPFMGSETVSQHAQSLYNQFITNITIK